MNTTINDIRKIFINLAVRDLKRSMEFFGKLGFCIQSEVHRRQGRLHDSTNNDACVMLLTEAFFKTFTSREICNTNSYTEALLALSCASRGEVDEIVGKAIAAGGKHAQAPVDHGFMYGWSFYDPDGHQLGSHVDGPTAMAPHEGEADETPEECPKARLARMRDIMAGHVGRGEMPGLVTLVSRRGEDHFLRRQGCPAVVAPFVRPQPAARYSDQA